MVKRLNHHNNDINTIDVDCNPANHDKKKFRYDAGFEFTCVSTLCLNSSNLSQVQSIRGAHQVRT